jgi:hypothetical protein
MACDLGIRYEVCRVLAGSNKYANWFRNDPFVNAMLILLISVGGSLKIQQPDILSNIYSQEH